MRDRERLFRATGRDHDELADVMFDAVRHGPSPYDDEQRRCWVPARPHGPAWSDRLDRQIVMVGRDAGGIAGFMSLAPGGYIDLAFVRPRARGSGLFRSLAGRIEGEGRARGDARLWVHASLMAIPAFAAMGFGLTEHQTVEVRGALLRRAEMEKIVGETDG